MYRKYLTFGLVWALAIAIIPMSARAQFQPPNDNNNSNDRPDPRQQVNDRLRELLEVERDDEWAVLQPKLERVLGLEARMGAAGPGVAASLGRRFRNFRFNADSPAIDEYQRYRQDLNRALSNPSTPATDIRTLIRSLRQARLQVEAELTAAREALIPFLTSRQEGILIQMGALE